MVMVILICCHLGNVMASSGGDDNTNNNDERFNLLIKWMREEEHAEVNDNLFQIKKVADFGKALVATKDIKQNTILFKLKQETLLDSKFVFERLFKQENAKALDTLKRLQEGDLSIFNAMVLMIVYLFNLAQSSNPEMKFDADAIKFTPYIGSLPRPFHDEGPKVAFLFGGEELTLLKGSTLLPSALTRRQSIANSFQKIVNPLLKDLKVLEPIRNTSSITLGLFEHFVSLSWSRIHSIYDYRIKTDRSCFVPLGDIINFSKTDANVISYTDKKTNELIFKTSKRVKAGNQLFVKYGKLTPTLNHILMMDYGFCPLDDPEIEFLNNTITVIDMRESVMKRMSNVDKKLNNQRVRLLSMTSLDEYHLTQTLYYNDDSFNLVEHTLSEIFDPNIIAIMRILSCDPVEIKALSDIANSLAPLDQKRDMIAKILINPISDRNEYIVIETIRGLIKQRLDNIIEMMKENDETLGKRLPVTMTQKCALRYIQSEKKILEIYLKILTPPITGKDEL